MLSVKEAKNNLFKSIGQMAASQIDIEDSVGYILADDIFSPIDIPSFDQSAMDGYAVVASKTSLANEQFTFESIGELKAGDNPDFKLQVLLLE